MSDVRKNLRAVADFAADYLESLPTRTVSSSAIPGDLAGLDRPLPEHGLEAEKVVADLVQDVGPGLVASSGPRYFGFVIGGTTPASLMADWLVSTWDQNAQVFLTSPASAVVEDVVARWVLELLGLPPSTSVGLVTGCQMANFTAMTVARNTLLERAGWDVDAEGLFGAPPIHLILSEAAHATVWSAARLMGLGTEQIHVIPADAEGCMLLSELQAQVEKLTGAPLLISLQAGNVNTGAFESVSEVVEKVRAENAWIHVDGAFGLWAAVSPRYRSLLSGFEQADSWSTDAHKWLNVPYDSGLVFLKDASQHQDLKTKSCAYAGPTHEGERNGSTWVPENSRRARGFVLYALLRELGRTGVVDLVERTCHLARMLADRVRRISGVSVVNDVVLNQVLLHLETPPGQESEKYHARIASIVQAEGDCWLGTGEWQSRPVFRVSICNWRTTESDVEILVEQLESAVSKLAR